MSKQELPWDESGKVNPNFVAPKATLVKARDFVPEGFIKAQGTPKGMARFRPANPIGGANFPGMVQIPTGYGRPQNKGERHMGSADQQVNAYADKYQKPAPSALSGLSDVLAKEKLMQVPDTLNIQQVGIDDTQGKVLEGKPKPRRKARTRQAKEGQG